MASEPSDLTPARAPETGPKKKKTAALAQADVPSCSLAEALRVARALAELGKQPSTPLQLARALGVQPTTGKFRTLLGSSAAYGLTEGGAWAEKVGLTDLGRAIVAPLEEDQSAAAIREAVLRPRVTRLFLEKYDSLKWPRDDIGRNVLEDLGIAAEQAGRALALIREDAEFAGVLTDVANVPYVELGSHQAWIGRPPETELAVVTDIRPHEFQREETGSGEPRVPAATGAPIRVFITHGRNRDIVNQIKEILIFGKYQPVVSVEQESTAKPVPDKVIDDMKSCYAGIVHVGSERQLLQQDGTPVVALNENVLIEIGAAMAFYGRRFVLLVEKGVTLPSNLAGLYEVRYEGERLDYEATMKLLRAFNEFQALDQ